MPTTVLSADAKIEVTDAQFCVIVPKRSSDDALLETLFAAGKPARLDYQGQILRVTLTGCAVLDGHVRWQGRADR